MTYDIKPVMNIGEAAFLDLQQQERRREKRQALSIYLRVFDVESGELLGYLADINTHGVMLLSRNDIQPGRKYMLDLHIDDKEVKLAPPYESSLHIHLPAESRWSRKMNSQLYGAGFMLTDLFPRHFSSIKQIIEELEQHHCLLNS